MGNQILAKALRPQSLDDMWGQKQNVAAIRNQIKSKRIPQCWMFVGETGSGKTTIARILARSLNCPHYTKASDFGRRCKLCRRSGEDTINVHEINGARQRKVEEIEGLVANASFAPLPPAKYRVYIIDEAHQMSHAAQNLLLKPTEDPPETTMWIVCTTDPKDIIKTLRGRFATATYTLAPVKDKTAEQFIDWAAEKINLERDKEEFYEAIHRNHLTSCRQILGALERYAAGFDPDQAVANLESKVDSLRISINLLKGDWDNIRPELEKATFDEAVGIRMAVSAFLRTKLLQKTPGYSLKRLAEVIVDLNTGAWGDERAQFDLLCAKLYKWTTKELEK